VFTEMANLMPALANITWERVEREDHVTYPVDGRTCPAATWCSTRAFPRPNGLAKLVAHQVHRAGRDAGRRVSVHPHHRPPARALAHRRDDAPRDRARRARAGAIARLSRGTHRQARHRAGRHGARPTRRGVVELAARQDDAVPDGVVFIPFAYVEAAANLLTNPKLDPFGKIPEFKVSCARQRWSAVEPATCWRGWRLE
jgi:formate dehydrogenase major subunit